MLRSLLVALPIIGNFRCVASRCESCGAGDKGASGAPGTRTSPRRRLPGPMFSDGSRLGEPFPIGNEDMTCPAMGLLAAVDQLGYGILAVAGPVAVAPAESAPREQDVLCGRGPRPRNLSVVGAET